MPERSGPWELLEKASDPIAADTAAIDARLTYFRSLSESMRVEGQRLSAIASGQALKGQYADELRSASGDVSKDLTQVVGRYLAVVQALTTYQPAVEVAMAGSARALDDAIDASNAQNTATVMPTATATASTPLTPPEVQANADKATATAAAADRVAAAKAELIAVLSALDEAGREAASTVRGGFNDGLTDSGWDRFKYAFAAFLKILVKVLTYIGMALAAIALLIPGVGELIMTIGIALAAVVLVANIALKAMGDGSWADIGIAIAGLLTFGAAKLFGPAIQSGLRAAMGSIRGATGWTSNVAEEVGSSVAGAISESPEELSGSVGGTVRDAEAVEETGEQVLTRYLGGDAQPLNSYLRTEGGAADATMETTASKLSAHLESLPSVDRIRTYRGLVGDFAKGLTRGDTYIDKGFMSTTRTLEKADDFARSGGALDGQIATGVGTRFVIDSENAGRDVAGGTGLAEHEVLFDQGTPFIISYVKSLPELATFGGIPMRTWVVGLKTPGFEE